MAAGSGSLDYHEETKHSELSIRTSAHYLDWANKPWPFKVYRNLPSIPLPHDFPHPRTEPLSAIKGAASKVDQGAFVLGTLAELLFFSAGLTRKVRFGSDVYYMRAASATGALYPTEVYVVCGQIPGLSAGVYHFNPLAFALVRLREGDFRPALVAVCGRDCLASPVTLAFTSFAWRNAWKYGARSYRHWFWDCGVIAANLLAVASSEGFEAKIHLGFVDSEVDNLLGLERGKEATVALVSIGASPAEAGRQDAQVPPISPAVEPLSKEEAEYPSIWRANAASSIKDFAGVENWRRSARPVLKAEASAGPRHRLRVPLKGAQIPTLTDVILRRGSTRRFARREVAFEQLSAVIDASTAGIPLDFLTHGRTLIDFYMIANAVQGLPSGSYFLNRDAESLELLKMGQFRSLSAYLCLEQPLFGDASAVFFLMADLSHIVSTLGDRGYRVAQFVAGVRAGKVYLSAYSLGIGASGSTFYDDAVTEFFSPHARGKSTMIAVGIGVPAYKARPGTILPQFELSSVASGGLAEGEDKRPYLKS